MPLLLIRYPIIMHWLYTLVCMCVWAGMPFYQGVHILKRQDRVVKGVQVWYSDQVSVDCNISKVYIHVEHCSGD